MTPPFSVLRRSSEELIMNIPGSKTTRALAVRALLLATAVPVLLLSSVGVAQAGPYVAGLEPWPGGLTVHIVNNNGTATWCTYSADSYRSLPFFLPANGKYDLVIVPSFPENRWWQVGVDCDNRNSYHSSEFY
jgi:hypothetical protein